MTATDAQIVEDATAIKALIQAFFDTINAADTKALQALFVRSASTTIIRQDPPLPPPGEETGQHHYTDGAEDDDDESPDEKLTVLLRTPVETLIKLLDSAQKKRKGQPDQPVIHEAPDLDATDVRADALFGTAWSPFRVTFDGRLHHYGTMVFVVTKVPEDKDAAAGGDGTKAWRIEGLTQNYRRTPGWPKAWGEGRRLFTTW